MSQSILTWTASMLRRENDSFSFQKYKNIWNVCGNYCERCLFIPFLQMSHLWCYYCFIVIMTLYFIFVMITLFFFHIHTFVCICIISLMKINQVNLNNALGDLFIGVKPTNFYHCLYVYNIYWDWHWDWTEAQELRTWGHCPLSLTVTEREREVFICPNYAPDGQREADWLTGLNILRLLIFETKLVCEEDKEPK